MNKTQLLAWRNARKQTQAEAAVSLGLSRRGYQKIELGDYGIPKAIWLATLALTHGLDTRAGRVAARRWWRRGDEGHPRRR